jgi:hypothetical protein
MVTFFTIFTKAINVSVPEDDLILRRNAASIRNQILTFRCNVRTARQTDGKWMNTALCCLQGVQFFFSLAQCTVSVTPFLIQTIYCAALPYSNQTLNNTVQLHSVPSTLYIRVTLY